MKHIHHFIEISKRHFIKWLLNYSDINLPLDTTNQKVTVIFQDDGIM